MSYSAGFRNGDLGLRVSAYVFDVCVPANCQRSRLRVLIQGSDRFTARPEILVVSG